MGAQVETRMIHKKLKIFSETPRDHFIIIPINIDRRDLRDTRGKGPLARNPERSWWHRHTS